MIKLNSTMFLTIHCRNIEFYCVNCRNKRQINEYKFVENKSQLLYIPNRFQFIVKYKHKALNVILPEYF